MLTISANPSSIAKDNGVSSVTAIGTGQDNLPMPDGTVVTFVTDIGGFDQGGQGVMTGGVARILFMSDGRNGSANVYARSGKTVSPSVTILIGTKAVGSIRLTANPGTLPKEGGKSKIVATIYSKDELPLPGIAVDLTTDSGRLASNGASLTTDINGRVADTLTVGANTTGASIDITVTASAGGTVSGTTTIQQYQ